MNRMLTKLCISALLIVSVTFSTSAQEKKGILGNKTLPSVEIADLIGNPIDIASYGSNGKITVFSFWATWCSPCKRELNTINEDWEDWVDDTGVKLVAVSIDDSRNMAKVKTYVDGKGWEYDVYLDPNGDFKRALGVNNVPHTFLVDGKGNVVWQHSGYSPGDEEELYELVSKVAAGESVK